MKLLTDERDDVDAFKSDFHRACRNLAKVLNRAGGAPDEVAAELIDTTKHVMVDQKTRGLNAHEVWHLIEFHHAVDWMMIIVERWLDSHADGSGATPTTISELAAEMFVGIAQRVAADYLNSAEDGSV